MTVADDYQGVLRDSQSGRPVVNANVVRLHQKTGTTSDSLGRFRLALPAGGDSVRITHISYRDTCLLVKDGVRPVIRLVPADYRMNEVEVNQSSLSSPEHFSYTIDHTIQRVVPFAFNDVSQTIHSLPGVTSNNEFSNRYNVRGGNFDENLIYINRVEVFQPVVLRRAIQENGSLPNPFMIKDLRFYSGGMDATYGDKLSSALDIHYYDQNQKSFSGNFHASLMDYNMMASWQLNPSTHLIAGIRHHRLASFFKNYKLKGNYAPHLSDLQFSLTHQINPRLRLNVLSINNWKDFYLAPSNKWVVYQDTYLFNFKRVDFVFEGDEQATFNTFVQAFSLNFELNPGLELQQVFTWYRDDESIDSDIKTRTIQEDYSDMTGSAEGDIDRPEMTDPDTGETIEPDQFNWHIIDNAFRMRQWSYKLAVDRRRSYQVGMEFSHHLLQEHIYEYNQDINSDIQINSFEFLGDNRVNSGKLSFYGNRIWEISPRMEINTGLRYYYNEGNHEHRLNPRLNFHYQYSPETDWYGSIGLYSQPPVYKEAGIPYNQENLAALKSQKSTEYILGVKRLSEGKRIIKAEAYYKDMRDLISYHLNDLQIIYSGRNDARAYAAGLDLYMGGNLVEDMYSWITYSYLNTKEDIRNDSLGYLPRPLEQNHTLTFFVQDQMKNYPLWKTSLKLILGSGFVNYYKKKQYDETNQVWRLVDNKQLYNRYPFYFRLDIGIYREIYWGCSNKIVCSIQFINIFDRQNVQFYQYIADGDN
ncbi:MAG: TonB-dependent receptor, partial [Candidatus Delongbacteria bacterium]|nr:TonB-dependent receptor [Candidatus Delongbacteria bacterium]